MSSCSLPKCVICYKNLASEDPHSSINSNSTKRLDRELSVIFLIKKFLKYPLICEDEGILEFMLMHQGNPSEWVKFCPTCLAIIQEAQQLHLVLTEMKTKLDTLRKLVENKVSKSFDEFSEEILHQKQKEDAKNKENSTFFTIRQAIYKNHIRPNLVSVKEEYDSDSDAEMEWPEPEGLAEIEMQDHIVIPDSQTICRTDFDEDSFGNELRKDEPSPPSTSIEIKKIGNKSSGAISSTTDPPRPPSNQNTHSNKDPKKSGVESRTCPLCHDAFERASEMTSHLESHNDVRRSSPKKKQQVDALKDVCKLSPTNIELQKKSRLGEEKHDYTAVPRKRTRNPIPISKEYITSDSESEDDKKSEKSIENDSDSDYSNPENEIDSELSENENDTSKDQFDELPTSQFKILPKKPRRDHIYNPEKRTCPVCKKLFKHSTVMRKHLKCVHEKTENFVCIICNKKYSWAYGLDRHMRRHEEEEGCVDFRPFKCSFNGCNMAFRYTSELNGHAKVHLPEKKFVCNICGTAVKDSRTLIRHQKIHSGIKEYLCPTCGDSFRFQSNLKRHELMKHEMDPDAPKLLCEQCGKSFKTKLILKAHEKIHTGIKEFSCPKCGDSFRYKPSLLRHDICKHQTEPAQIFTCDQCGKSFKIKSHLDQHLKSISHGGVGFRTKTSTASKNIQAGC